MIKTGEDRLAALYAFNVNGCFFIDEYEVKVRPTDHVLIVTLALGGWLGGRVPARRPAFIRPDQVPCRVTSGLVTV